MTRRRYYETDPFLWRIPNAQTEEEFRDDLERAVLARLNDMVFQRRKGKRPSPQLAAREIIDEYGEKWAAMFGPIPTEAEERYYKAREAVGYGFGPTWKMWGCLAIMFDEYASSFEKMTASEMLRVLAEEQRDIHTAAALGEKYYGTDGDARYVTKKDIGEALDLKSESGAANRIRDAEAFVKSRSREVDPDLEMGRVGALQEARLRRQRELLALSDDEILALNMVFADEHAELAAKVDEITYRRHMARTYPRSTPAVEAKAKAGAKPTGKTAKKTTTNAAAAKPKKATAALKRKAEPTA